MLRANPLKARLAGGKRCLGVWLIGNAALPAEILARAGYDFALIDHEHGPGDFMGAIGQMQALRSGGGDAAPAAVMRVPWNDPIYIKRALDAGIEAIMVPMVESADQARAVVDACRYPPAGSRGCAIGAVRAAGFGADSAAYWEAANREILVIAQIETPAAVEAVPEIAAVDGVDVLFIGPNDLTVNAGFNPIDRGAEAEALIERAETAILATGKPMATVTHPGKTPQDMFERGYAMVTGGSDLSLLRRAAVEQVSAHRAANG